MLNEAMNFCEKRGYVYAITWWPMKQWEFMLHDPDAHDEVVKHLEEWMAHE